MQSPESETAPSVSERSGPLENLMIATLPTRNASELAAGAIREAIISGELRPGERLKEAHLAKRLGVSRTPVREALLLLQSERLVEATPNRGSIVRPYSPADIKEIYQLRALLEGYGCRVAAANMTDEIAQQLFESCERFRKLPGGATPLERSRENFKFHETILLTAGSPRLSEMVLKTIELPLVYGSFAAYSDEQQQQSEYYHDHIAKALEKRDAERAELLMKEHMFTGRDFLMESIATDKALTETNE
jgi:DNA-binding GntR family transcriptional regulator